MKLLSRPVILLLLAIVSLVALAGRCWYLQCHNRDFYRRLALKQQVYVSEKPQRGVILDRKGRVLAASNRIQTVFAEPRAIENPRQTAEALAPVINMPADEICRIITETKNPGFVRIKAGLSQEERDAVLKRAIHGIGVQSDWRRFYPMANLACHVVGFTGVDGGLAGIELEYNKNLEGLASEHVFFADAFRRPIRLKEQKDVYRDGFNLILTIDAAVQQFTRCELARQLENYQAESGVGIVMVPATGEVLAMVSLPDFDPTAGTFDDPKHLCNHALTGPYEPGSIIKPVVAAIALDRGVVTPGEKIFCENGSYGGSGFGRIGEYGNHRFGSLTVRDILVKSSNIGMAKIGQGMGKEKLYNGLKLFGFGKKTGIDLPGEDAGVLWPTRKWTGYSVTRIPFGQEISVTAMQIAQAYCMLINGARPVRPYVLKAVVDSEGRMIECKEPVTSAGCVIRPEVAQWIVHEALKGVVDEGTGTNAALKGWQVFGKTGTANVAKTDQKGYDEDSYIASFIGGAPLESPAVVVLVSIYKPDKKLGKGYTGGTVAAPVVRNILQKTLTYMKKN